MGNRLGRSGGTFGAALPNQSDGTFDRSGKLLAYNGQQFQYDANMNMKTSLLVGGAIAGEDSYDYEDHLIARTPTSGAGVTILYDAEGNKVKRTGPTGTIYYLVDNQNPTGYAQVLEERTQSGTGAMQVANRFTYGSTLVSQSDTTGLKWYYGLDGHGNVRTLVNANGNTLAAYDYDAFGIQTRSDGTLATSNTHLYCAEEFDKDLGLYYLRARFYNPQIGRFTSFDSFEGSQEEPLSLNKYLFANSDPCNGTDPTGHENLVGQLAATAIRSGLYSMALSAPVRAYTAAKQFQAGMALGDIAYDFTIGELTDGAIGAVMPGLLSAGSRLVPIGRIVQTGGQVVGRAANSVWNMASSTARGRVIEEWILGRLPSTLAAGLKSFPVIDDFMGGIATSIKTIGLTDKTYLAPRALKKRIVDCAIELAEFKGHDKGLVKIAEWEIKKRVLLVVMEEGAANTAQANALIEAVLQARIDAPFVQIVLKFIP